MLFRSNVGIGTNAPTAKLDVNGAAKISSDLSVGGSGSLSFGERNGQLINLFSTKLGIGVQTNTLYFRTNGNFAWYKDGSHNDNEVNAGSIGNTKGTALMVIRSGNVGIGTDNPENGQNWGKVLDIYDEAYTKLSVRTKDIDGRFLAHQSGFWNSQPGMILGTQSEHALSFGTNHTTRMTILSGGNVGIGTNNPTAKLDVAGDAKIGGNVSIQKINGTTGIGFDSNSNTISPAGTVADQDLGLKAKGTGLVKVTSPSGTALMVINTDGNVGIGTTAPTAKLHVNNGNAIISGNVGIGTTAPKATLHVNGGNSYIVSNVRIGEPLKVWTTLAVSAFISRAGETNRVTSTAMGQIQINDFLNINIRDTSGNATVVRTRVIAVNYSNNTATTENALPNFDRVLFSVSRPESGAFDNHTDCVLSVAPGRIEFDADGTKGGRFTIENTNGYVGIGTNNPQAKLDVNGNLKVQGDVNITGKFLVNGQDISSTKRVTADQVGALPASGGNVTGDLSVGGSLSFGSRGAQLINLYSTTHGIGVQNNTTYFRTSEIGRAHV